MTGDLAISIAVGMLLGAGIGLALGAALVGIFYLLMWTGYGLLMLLDRIFGGKA